MVLLTGNLRDLDLFGRRGEQMSGRLELFMLLQRRADWSMGSVRRDLYVVDLDANTQLTICRLVQAGGAVSMLVADDR